MKLVKNLLLELKEFITRVERMLECQEYSKLIVFLKLFLKKLSGEELLNFEIFKDYFFSLSERHLFVYEKIQDFLNLDPFKYNFTGMYRDEVIMNIESKIYNEIDEFDPQLFFTSENWLTNIFRVYNSALNRKYSIIYKQDE